MKLSEDRRPRRGFQTVFAVGAVVTVALAIVLVCSSRFVAKGVYRMGFFLGLSVFVVILFCPSGSWDARMMGHIPSRLSLILMIFIGMAPSLLLLESGIAGYRGFSSWMHYLSLEIGRAHV